MKFKSGEIYHVYNRGNNRQRLFYERENYLLFLQKVRKYVVPQCDILAYCLMPNHFHFLVHANNTTVKTYRSSSVRIKKLLAPRPKMSRFSKGLQLLLSSYAKAMNTRYSRNGSLFRQNTKWKRTSDELFSFDYSLPCFQYIHYNPVSAGLVGIPEAWDFSSYREYRGLAPEVPICNIELARSLLALDRSELFYPKGEIPTEILKKIFK